VVLASVSNPVIYVNEKITLHGGEKAVFQADNSLYWNVNPEDGTLRAEGTAINDFSEFQVQVYPNNAIALMTLGGKFNGLYMCRININNTDVIQAWKESVDGYCLFPLTSLTNGQVALCGDNHLFLSRYFVSNMNEVRPIATQIDEFCVVTMSLLVGK
jgi:hypothetical protein